MTAAQHALHEWVQQRVHACVSTALRADPDAINAAVTHLVGHLDPHSRHLLRNARPLVLGCATALIAVLEAHRPQTDPSGRQVCRACRTPECPTLHRVAQVMAVHGSRPIVVDRAEAWRRADACLSRDRHPVPIEIREFEYGYVAWPAHGPDANGFLLVIDHHTGALTRWPRLPLETLALQYRAYLAAHSPTRDHPPQK
ncbi:hypothetical protein Acsp04_58120 [Actinomadura sp. NBRC 104425]|jgi:hypothetical protein|uniref:hypothetical protein n=1 Tax=Actinomadura sp. NBRC 104425 TaxID=3032204 RepID=UPI0024A46FF0|nr:hypothetical protein [Actinomadura sp. NBRC 104425]GLZ15577.1 hypothetical protein Acsp04_58120 [Actinomadura sp. NBRC 104425]